MASSTYMCKIWEGNLEKIGGKATFWWHHRSSFALCPLFFSWLHTSGCPLWPCPRELVCALSHKRDMLGCGEDGKDEGNKQQGEIGMKACTCVWSKTSCQHWRWKCPNYSILLFFWIALKSNTCQPWGKAWIPQSPAPAYVSSDICSTESSDSFLSCHVDSMTVYTEPLYCAGYDMRKLPNDFKKKCVGWWTEPCVSRMRKCMLWWH